MADDIRGELTKIYIAFFNRAPDPEGLAFWENEYVAAVAGGKDPADILNDIANSFAISDEAQSLYPFIDNPSPSQIDAFIIDAYQNMFGRAPDAEGLAYWAGRVQEELLASRPVGSILVDIQSGAQNTVSGQDLATLDNKVDVGLAYADAFEASGAAWTPEDDLDDSKSVVEDVDGTPESVVEAGGKIDEIIKEQTDTPGDDDGGPNPPAEILTVTNDYEDLTKGTNGDDLLAGSGNPASGFARTTIEGDQDTNIEIGLDARYRGDGAEVRPENETGERILFDMDAGRATDVRFAYSVGTDAPNLDAFDYRLLVDSDGGLGTTNTVYSLERDANSTGSGSPYNWVSEDDGTISDDGGNDSVTQNIQSFGWLPGDDFQAGDIRDVTLQVFHKGTDNLVGESTITLADIEDTLNGALVLGDNAGTLFAGAGNPNENFAIASSGGVELGISGRYWQGADIVEGVDADGNVRFGMDAGEDVRFAFSVATDDGIDLSDYAFKLKVDIDATDEEDFVEFNLAEVGGVTVWQRADGGGDITDSYFSGNVSQDIQNIAWYDDDSASAYLGVGEYEVVLEAYRDDGVTLIAQNTAVFDIS